METKREPPKKAGHFWALDHLGEWCVVRTEYLPAIGWRVWDVGFLNRPEEYSLWGADELLPPSKEEDNA